MPFRTALDVLVARADGVWSGPSTGASIAAQLLLNNRRIENWVLWVAIDVVSIGLYLFRDLFFLAVLYVAFLVISVIGLREWTRASRPNGMNEFR